MLVEWRNRLKKGKLKFFCEEIVKQEDESVEALKALFDGWKAYNLKMDPKDVERKKVAEEKAKKKVAQKRKQHDVVKGEGTIISPRAQIAETQAVLEKFGIVIPPASDFTVVLWVYECTARIAKDLDDLLDIMLLKKKVKKLSVVNSDLEADLIDREDKLDGCNEDVVPNLLEENRLVRGQINSLSTARAQIAEAEAKLTAG